MNEYEILSKLKRLKPYFLELNEKRFASGYTWKRFNGVLDVLFKPENQHGLNADKRLLAFLMCCVLDRQVPVEKVWSEGVNQSIDYIQHKRRECPQLRLNESCYLRKQRKPYLNMTAVSQNGSQAK